MKAQPHDRNTLHAKSNPTNQQIKLSIIFSLKHFCCIVQDLGQKSCENKREFHNTPVANTGYFSTGGQHIALCSPAGGHIYVSCFFPLQFCLAAEAVIDGIPGREGVKV